MINIDRKTSPFQNTSFEIFVKSHGWHFDCHDEKSLLLKTISVNNIQLKDILHSNNPVVWNDEITSGLEGLRDEGFILLDAQVLRTLMKLQSLPKEWAEIADSDWIGGGSIRFDGSIITSSNDPSFRRVFSPMFSRGIWMLGTNDVLFSPDEIRRYEESENPVNPRHFRQLTAVINPSLCI